MILNIKTIKQLKDYCGPACVEMVLRFYGKRGGKYSQEAIGNRYSIDYEGGTTITMILEMLDHYRIKSLVIRGKRKANPKKICKYLDKYKCPIIIYTYTHYLVATGYTKNAIYIIDPFNGKKIRRSKKGNFWKVLTGFIVCRRQNV